MTAVKWIKSCTRLNIIGPICIVGFLANFLLFSHYSSHVTRTSRESEWATDVVCSSENPVRFSNLAANCIVMVSTTVWNVNRSVSNGKLIIIMCHAVYMSSEHRTKTDTRELVYLTQKQESSYNYNKYENVRHILSDLAKSDGHSFQVIKDLLSQVETQVDVRQALAALERTNMFFPDSLVWNRTQFLNTTKTLKARCPRKPPGLLGHVPSNLASVVPQFLEKNYASLRGGHYAPELCTAVEKLAIIIPFRNRHTHLHILLNNLLPVLIRQQLDFRIFVIDQAVPSMFNRCLLFNIGYLEALKLDNYDCFIFHDVDMIVLNDNCLYRCSQHPRHLTAAISKWKYRLPYTSFFGGVVAFTRQQFRNINGCSNVYFGWGGEDDDLRSRVDKAGYTVFRYAKDIGRYDTIVHMPDAGNSPKIGRAKLLQSMRDRLDSQGLNTTVYDVTSVHLKPLYTWIHVHVNMTQILQMAPTRLLNEFIKDDEAN